MTKKHVALAPSHKQFPSATKVWINLVLGYDTVNSKYSSSHQFSRHLILKGHSPRIPCSISNFSEEKKGNQMITNRLLIRHKMILSGSRSLNREMTIAVMTSKTIHKLNHTCIVLECLTTCLNAQWTVWLPYYCICH